MRTRMYVTLPDMESAGRLADDLLLARIDDRRMHFLAKRGTDLGHLHEASYLQKSDTVHGAFVGFGLGGILGALLGLFLVEFPPRGATLELVTVLVSAVAGAGFGVWIAGMVGLQVPNSRLKAFQSDIDAGRILLILDVPASRQDEVRDIVARRHPEAADGGIEPTVPAFP
jgi:hypothetical protein